QAVGIHGAETEMRRLAPLVTQFESAVADYENEAQRLLQVAQHNPQFIDQINQAISASNEAFALGQTHMDSRKKLLITTELEYNALSEFEQNWQYFSADLKDTRFILPDNELPARWLLDSLEQDANQA